MKPFTPFKSTLAPLPINNIDTDQIIPARFLKTTSKEGLDKNLFCDWRYNADGSDNPNFILNTPRGKKAKILARARSLGAHPIRVPSSNQYLLRGYIPRERAQELSPADHRPA